MAHRPLLLLTPSLHLAQMFFLDIDDENANQMLALPFELSAHEEEEEEDYDYTHCDAEDGGRTTTDWRRSLSGSSDGGRDGAGGPSHALRAVSTRAGELGSATTPRKERRVSSGAQQRRVSSGAHPRRISSGAQQAYSRERRRSWTKVGQGSSGSSLVAEEALRVDSLPRYFPPPLSTRDI